MSTWELRMSQILLWRKISILIGLMRPSVCFCLGTSREILFHIETIGTPNEVWVKFESLFGKTDEMRGHHLENELILLSPADYETIEDLFTKFKELVIQLK